MARRCLRALTLALIASWSAPLWAEPSQEPPPPAVPGTGPEVPAATGVPSADGRRAGNRLFANAARNTIGLFSVENVRVFLAGAAATGVSTAFDDDVRAYFSKTRRARWLGDAIDVEGQPLVIVPMAAVLFGAGRLTSHEHQRFRDATYDIAEATAVEAIYSTSIKYATRRLRPDGSNHLSFPSGHASNAFSWATVAARHYGPKFGVPAYLVAALIGVGRMEKNAHYLSDVVGGATLGCLVGLTVTRRDSEPLPGERRMRLEPSISRGGGLGVRASLEF